MLDPKHEEILKDPSYQPKVLMEGKTKAVLDYMAENQGRTDIKIMDIGAKNDQTKPRPSLLPFNELKEVVQVFEYGAQKYSDDNWQKVERERYMDALLRHAFDLARGQIIDPDSGLPHSAHIAANALILSWHDKQ